jgi:hypothetical protein
MVLSNGLCIACRRGCRALWTLESLLGSAVLLLPRAAQHTSSDCHDPGKIPSYPHTFSTSPLSFPNMCFVPHNPYVHVRRPCIRHRSAQPRRHPRSQPFLSTPPSLLLALASFVCVCVCVCVFLSIQISLGYFVFDLAWSLITGGETLSVLCHHIVSIAVCSTGLVRAAPILESFSLPPSLPHSVPPSHPSSLFLPTNTQLKPRFCPKPSLRIRISLTHTFSLVRCSAHLAQKSWARSSALKSATLFCKQGGSWSIPGSRARPSTALRTYLLLSSSSFAGLYTRPSRRSFSLYFSTSFSLS